jgi:hypothetical protein
MPRGGKRQGIPGKAYSNRTDMTSDYMNGNMSAASGGMKPPAAPTAPPQSPQANPNQRYPEDTPMLTDPTNRPNEPITAGLSTGPGVGPEALDTRVAETKDLQRFLPMLEPLLDAESTPDSVRMLVRYIRAM